MAKIDRYGGNLEAFASEAQGQERTVFGTETIDDSLTAQVNALFKRGWGIVAPTDSPTLQDFNAAMYTATQLLAYLHQAGIAEWNQNQLYYAGTSACLHQGRIWIAAVDEPTDEPTSASVQWESVLSPDDISSDATPETLAKRDAAGTFKVSEATDPAHPVRKQEFDAHLQDTGAAQKSANLSDLSSASAARQNLGLGSAATQNAQTSPTDTTAGALMAVGAFGVGGRLGMPDANLPPMGGGFYDHVFDENSTTNTGYPRLGDGYIRHWNTIAFGPESRKTEITSEVFGQASQRARTFIRVKHDADWFPWVELYHTGNVSSFAQTLLDDADAAAARATLEAVSSTDVDAKFTGTNVSLAANGYQRLPSGLIIQWGQNSVPTSASVTVTLPITFPNTGFSATTAFASDGDYNDSCGAYFSGTSSLVLRNGSATRPVNWIAVGY